MGTRPVRPHTLAQPGGTAAASGPSEGRTHGGGRQLTIHQGGAAPRKAHNDLAQLLAAVFSKFSMFIMLNCAVCGYEGTKIPRNAGGATCPTKDLSFFEKQ